MSLRLVIVTLIALVLAGCASTSKVMLCGAYADRSNISTHLPDCSCQCCTDRTA